VAEFGGWIKLNGKSYVIDLQSYKVQDITDFSPRGQTGGQSIIHSELGLYQPLLQSDWRHGFGFMWYADAMGYLRTEGQVDTRHPDIAMLMTAPSDTDTAAATKEGFVVFDGRVYSYGSTGSSVSGLRTYSASTWDNVNDSGAAVYGAINYLLPTKSYLFVCPDGSRIVAMDTADASSLTGVNANSTDYKWLCIHNGNIYAGKDDSNIVYYDSNTGLAQLAGDPADDTNEIVVGQGSYNTLGALSFLGKLYVFKPDGMWEIGEDNISRKILDYGSQASADNFRSWAVLNSQIIYPIRDKIYSWNGVRVTQITPPPLTDVFPYTTYGRFDNFVVIGERLYLTARTNESTYEEHILCFDGVGWHKMAEPLATGAGSITAMGYDAANDYLWYHTSDTEETTHYIQFQAQSDYPHANFPTSGTHSLVTSRLDMGFRRVIKSTPSIIVGGSNLNSTRYLRLYYQTDGSATWDPWGGADSVSNIVSSDGVTELFNPLTSAYTNSIEYNHLQLKVDFVTDTSGNSPVLEDLTVRFLMRPDESYGYSFALVAAESAQFGTSMQDDRLPRQIMDDLRAARASKTPVSYEDPFGNEHYVYVSSYVEQAVEYHGDKRGTPDIEHRVLVNLVEVA